MMPFRFLLFIFSFFAFSSCVKYLRPSSASASYFSIDSQRDVDSSVIRFIQPYRDSLAKDMQEIIAISAMAMDKRKPESLLGNFVADLLLEKGKEYYGEADFCVVNYGGLRIPTLPEGEITKGMIFELMPFDNFLIMLELNGTLTEQMIQRIAMQGGWPVSGIKFKIKDGKAFDILINNLPLQPGKNYRVVISDYLADGGDHLSMLRSAERKNSGVLLRDAIIDFLKEQSRNGKMISSQLDKRVVVE